MASKPEMIMFDYGQTIIAESNFDPLRGNSTLLKYAVKNSNNITAAQIQELADSLSKEINDVFSVQGRSYQKLELTDYAFDKYLYEYLEIEFSLTPPEMEWVFWSNAAPGNPTKNIERVLEYLYQTGIRTAVISNMMFSTQSLRRRINEILPKNHFEFIVASSDYMFRKPHPRIFELALKKEGISADKVWFCGDNLYCDIEGAYYAGMKPIWYPAYIDSDYGVHTVVPYTQIDDWNQLIELIEKNNE
jgi:putative hydrolase of the HAD superfamily